SVLAAELVGARTLLKLLDSANTRVNVISFGRDRFFHWGCGHLHRRRGQPHWDYLDPRMPDARVEQPLTSDYWKVREALARIRARGPRGGTNIAAAIREATAELIGARADGLARPEAKKVMLLLTDGFPSSPAGSPDVADPEDIILALRAAYLARKAGIKIHPYALGPGAVAIPFALIEIARITGGRFHTISDPSQVVYRLQEGLFVRLESLVVENATLSQPAGQVALGPEGAYIATVPVKAGVNKITVTGIANDGTRGGTSVLLNYLPTGERDPALQLTKREMALSPDIKSFDDL
ncbi:MAG: VWA domain-containing protein, partial [Chloroflexi bacterium]|nr:VWA domain-containing protein [Chloroflexota bacterium]